MKYAVEMGSVAMTYIPSFIYICSAIRKLIVGTYTDRQRGDRISLFSFFFKIRKVGKKNKIRLMRSTFFVYVCPCIPPPPISF
jgi:hypothetical protein